MSVDLVSTDVVTIVKNDRAGREEVYLDGLLLRIQLSLFSEFEESSLHVGPCATRALLRLLLSDHELLLAQLGLKLQPGDPLLLVSQLRFLVLAFIFLLVEALLAFVEFSLLLLDLLLDPC